CAGSTCSGLRSGSRRLLGSRGGGRCGGLSRSRGLGALAPRPAGARTTVTARAAARSARAGRGLLAGELLLGHVALVDPDLDADLAEGRLGLVQTEVDVRAERVQ